MNLTARCIVEIDGTRYDSRDKQSRLVSVTIDTETNLTGEAVVTFADPRFELTDRHTDSTGMRYAEARVWLGYGGDLGEACFGGRLVGVEHDSQRVGLRFHDKSRDMKLEKKSRYHAGKTDVEIMRDVAAEYGLDFQTVGSVIDSERHASLMQRNSRDWDFIRSLASRAGWNVWVDGNTLYAQEAGVQSPGGTVLTYRQDFLFLRPLTLTFKLPENRRGRARKAVVTTRGPDGSRISGESAGNYQRGRLLSSSSDLPHHTRQAAERHARGLRLKSGETAFECRIQLLPAAGRQIGIRSVVTLAEAGQFFGGDYVVRAARRAWHGSQLLDDLTLGRDIGGLKK
jgi:hypothetical protein